MIFIIDFDGTLAQHDTVDQLLARYADASWKTIEERWLAGEIDAQECMRHQLELVRAGRGELQSYFDNIALDPHFARFYACVSSFARVAVVSDGLDHAITSALDKAGLVDLPVFANHLHFHGADRVSLSFPHRQPACQGGNGVCKCEVSRQIATDEPIVLIGDGKSDACLAREADVVFAKGSLIAYCEAQGIEHIPFRHFGDVLDIVNTWTSSRCLALTA